MSRTIMATIRPEPTAIIVNILCGSPSEDTIGTVNNKIFVIKNRIDNKHRWEIFFIIFILVFIVVLMIINNK